MKNTVYINFSLRKYESDQTLQFNGISFSEVDTTIYLGIILDKILSFSHIRHICNKVLKMQGFCIEFHCVPQHIS